MKPESKAYQALLQERADLVAEGKRMFEAADASGDVLTVEQKTRDDAINARLDEIAGDLERHEKRRERERAVSVAPAFNKLPRGDNEEAALAHFWRTGAEIRDVTERDGRFNALTVAIPSYSEMKAAAVDSTMNITTAADGQNIVPTGFVPRVATRKNESDLTVKLGLQNVPGIGTTVNYPVEGVDPVAFAATSEQDDAHAQGYERDAGVTNLKAFTLAKKSRKVELTEELLSDNDVNLNAYIADRIGRQIAKTHNTMLLAEVATNGTALKTYASASAIAAGELEGVLGNDALGYYLSDGASAAWVMRPSTLWAVRILTGNFRLYSAMDNEALGGNQLLGYPVYFSQAAAAPAASAKDVYFGAWDQVGYREDPTLRFIMDPFTVDGLVILKYSFRAVYGVLQAAAIGYAAHPSA